ncbi:MAG: protein kinase domain-containing protein, partial [Polyangiales bacterium]
ETFLAVRRGPGDFEQRICIKRMLPALERDKAFVDLFLAEARTSAQLRHRNIVQLLDFGQVEGRHYLALELIEGLDLAALLRGASGASERLPTPLVIYLGLELATALEYAHKQGEGVVHRDLSPGNVLLSRAGEVKLSDFGIAKAVGRAGGTRSGVLKGKVPYLPPEYVRSGEFSVQNDLYALGITLFECLTGRRPYDAPTELATLQRASTGVHTALAELDPEGLPDLHALVTALIKPDPAGRPQAAAAVVDALAQFAPPPTARRELAAWVERHAPLRQAADSETALAATVAKGHASPAPQTPTTAVALPSQAVSGRHLGDVPARTAALAGSRDVTRTQLPEAGALLPGQVAETAAASASASGDTPAATASAIVLAAQIRGRRGRLLALGMVAGVLPVLGLVAYRSVSDAPATATASAADDQASPSTPAAASAAPAAPRPAADSPATSAATQPATATAPRPDNKAAASTAPASAAGTHNETASTTRAKTTAPPELGRIRVVVTPHGKIWIDDRPRGAAPRTLRLRPGRHVLAVGQNGPLLMRDIEVRAGQRAITYRFDLPQSP